MTIRELEVDIPNELHYILFKIFNIVFKWGMTDNDLKVFSALCDKNEVLRSTIFKHKERMTVLFSPEIRKELIKRIEIPYNSFNNSLFKLRKKGFLEKNSLLRIKNSNGRFSDLNPWMISFDKNNYNLTLNFVNESRKS